MKNQANIIKNLTKNNQTSSEKTSKICVAPRPVSNMAPWRRKKNTWRNDNKLQAQMIKFTTYFWHVIFFWSVTVLPAAQILPRSGARDSQYAACRPARTVECYTIRTLELAWPLPSAAAHEAGGYFGELRGWRRACWRAFSVFHAPDCPAA